jgi:hypothetical protein
MNFDHNSLHAHTVQVMALMRKLLHWCCLGVVLSPPNPSDKILELPLCDSMHAHIFYQVMWQFDTPLWIPACRQPPMIVCSGHYHMSHDTTPNNHFLYQGVMRIHAGTLFSLQILTKNAHMHGFSLDNEPNIPPPPQWVGWALHLQNLHLCGHWGLLVSLSLLIKPVLPSSWGCRKKGLC